MGEQVAARYIWGCSSVGRAPALQAGGHEFESHHLHESNILLLFLNLENRIQKLNFLINQEKTSEAVGQ